jgi:phenylacetate-CoA ligase
MLARELARPSNVRLGVRSEREVRRQPDRRLAADRLRSLLEYAAGNVPFYSELLGWRGLGPEVTLADFPVLTKDVLKREFANLIGREEYEGIVCHDTVFITRTGGSTGMTASHLKADAQDGFFDRVTYARILRDYGVSRTGDMYHVGLHTGVPAMMDLFLLPPRGYLTFRFMGPPLFDEESLGEVLALVDASSPVFVFGIPTRICRLGELLQEHDRVKRPHVVLTSYEQLTEAARAQIQKAFQCPVVNVYASSETGMTGWECRAGRVHFPSDLKVVEVVDEQGKPVSAGETGDVVITPLFSRVMPLIRYAPGDRAIAASSPCACGSQEPSVEKLLGRVLPSYRLRSGKTLDPYWLVWSVDALNLPSFQLVQEAPGRLRVVVPAGTWIAPDMASGYEQRVSEFMGEATEVRFDLSGEFILAPSGKRNPFVQSPAE